MTVLGRRRRAAYRNRLLTLDLKSGPALHPGKGILQHFKDRVVAQGKGGPVTSATHQQEPVDTLVRAEATLGRMRRWPSFEPAVERRYEAYSSERRNRALGFWLLFGLALRVLGLATEFSIGGDMPLYGLRVPHRHPCPRRAGLAVVPVAPMLGDHARARGHGCAVSCVVGLALLGAAAPHPNEIRYFFLVGVNIVAINVVMPLRFQHAVAFTVASMTVYLSMALSGLGGIEPWSVLDIVFLYSMASIASLVVAYRNDVIDRRAFLASERINAQAAAWRMPTRSCNDC